MRTHLLQPTSVSSKFLFLKIKNFVSIFDKCRIWLYLARIIFIKAIWSAHNWITVRLKTSRIAYIPALFFVILSKTNGSTWQKRLHFEDLWHIWMNDHSIAGYQRQFVSWKNVHYNVQDNLWILKNENRDKCELWIMNKCTHKNLQLFCWSKQTDKTFGIT